MKKILILLLIALSFNFSQTNAGESKMEKKIVPTYSYEKSYKLEKEIMNLSNEYYYAIVFKKWNEQEIYSKASKKFDEYKKMNEGKYWFDSLELSYFMNNPNSQRILNELGYHSKYVDRYGSKTSDDTFFVKNFNIDLKDIKLNDKVEWIYFWMKVNSFEKNEDRLYDDIKKLTPKIKNLASVYTKYNSKEVEFKKIDLDKFDWKVQIDITKIIKKFKEWNQYRVAFNFYFKVGDNYVALLKYNINSSFSFDKYSIQRSFEQKYINETTPIEDYSYNYINKSNSVKDKTEEKLNEKLSTIFNKIKEWKTKAEYIKFLKVVKTKVLKFNNNKEKYNELYTLVKDKKSYDSTYSKYLKIKDKEKIVNILLLFINNEIYENDLETTIQDFIK